MIYIVSLIVCAFLAWMYDVLGCTKNKWHWYYLLMVWFIAVSGFQYMVGVDTPVYMEEYDNLYKNLRFDIGEFEGNRQPGWVLFCFVCRQITSDFTLFKLIQAAFVNIAIFSFFKRESKYVFVCITLYALSSYLLINFNILRQSISLAFILYFISYYKKKKYMFSALFFIMAYMFHNSALLALVIPIFGFLKYNKRILVGVTSFFIIFIFVLFKMDFESIMSFLFGGDYLGEGVSEMGEMYINSDRLGVREAKMGIVRWFRISILLGGIVFYINRYREMYIGGLGMVFIIFLLLSFVIPILFRFGVYFELPFYIVLSSVIIEFPLGRLKQIRYLFYIMAFIFCSYFPCIDYFARYPGTPYRYIDQYYPYVSIFNAEDIDHKKVNYFKGF